MEKEKMELEMGHAACTGMDEVRIYCGFETPLCRVLQEDRSMFLGTIVSAILRKKVHTNMCL
jgi:hypothetical protein